MRNRKHRNRRIRRKEIKKRRIMIVISMFAVTFLFASGYAAFQTNISINVKGNIKEKANTLLGRQKVYLSKTGDGLYTDPVENGRYVYKGTNPDNYICLEEGSGTCSENNLYRIIAKEADGTLKVIKNTSIGNMPWDLGYNTNLNGITETNSTAGTRYSDMSEDFCYYSLESDYGGCKSWGSKTTTYNSIGIEPVTTMPLTINSAEKKLPTYESYINAYLNGGKYLNTSNEEITVIGWITTQNSLITNNISENHIFSIGTISAISGQSLNTDILLESSYKWKGNIGLMNATDYVKSNTNTLICESIYNVYNNYEECKTTNWLYNGLYQWTISPVATGDSRLAWGIYPSGILSGSSTVGNSRTIRPVFFLKSTISLMGKGTNDSNVYRIV